jgi:hypothetical protein
MKNIYLYANVPERFFPAAAADQTAAWLPQQAHKKSGRAFARPDYVLVQLGFAYRLVASMRFSSL